MFILIHEYVYSSNNIFTDEKSNYYNYHGGVIIDKYFLIEIISIIQNRKFKSKIILNCELVIKPGFLKENGDTGNSQDFNFDNINIENNLETKYLLNIIKSSV